MTNHDEAHILIVDDIPQFAGIGQHPERERLCVSVASSGQGALEAIMTNMPDVVLLDIQMPDMDDFDVQPSKENPETTDFYP